MIGQTLGHYRIEAKLGEGGMGVVYKARDMHLDRPVAIKVLPAEAVANPDRKRRFVQEAKAASALNHPNIVTIYDIGSVDGIDYIAMEYISGQALDRSIPRKGLRINEALGYAIQIADALWKAHAAGILHRDIKPGNVMITDEGHVKLLDFGLAKLIEPEEPSDSTPTRTARTQNGAILGTLSYMAPEQAEGRPLDARADIFALGAVLYEMLTGERAFQGVLRDEPKPPSQIAAGLPREVDRVVRRCLRRDPARRFQSAADLKVALAELREESESGTLDPSGPARHPSRAPFWIPAFVTVVLAGVAGLWYFWPRSTEPDAALRPVPLTTYPGLEVHPSLSPDGNQVAFVWNGEKQDNLDIYVKLIGQPGEPLRLTSDPRPDLFPAWSPDGAQIAFWRIGEDQQELILIPALGGPERKLIEFPRLGMRRELPMQLLQGGLAWSPDGRFLLIATPDPGARVRGQVPRISLINVATGETHPIETGYSGTGRWPGGFSPDGRSIIFVRITGGAQSELYRQNLTANLRSDGKPQFLPTGQVYNVAPCWTADGREILFAAGAPGQLGLWRMAPSSSARPRPVAATGAYAASPATNGARHRLVYSAFEEDVHLWQVSLATDGVPAGSPTALTSASRRDSRPQFSPDGMRIAFISDRTGTPEIWVADRDGSRAAPITSFRGPVVRSPRWSPDGRQIAFQANAEGQYDIYLVNASGGSPRRFTTDPANEWGPSWSADGKFFYFSRDLQGQFNVWRVPVSPEGGAPSGPGAAVQITRSNNTFFGVESPDGRFLYLTKGETASTLWRMPLPNGEEEMLLEGATHWPNFAITSRGIYYTAREGDERASIYFYDLATRQVREIVKLPKPVSWGLTLSPDQRTLVWSQRDRFEADLMLVENFR